MIRQIAEIERRLLNLIRVGTVESVDYGVALARVRLGDVISAPLPWLTMRAMGDRTWWAPEPGEQVVVLSPSGDLAQGVILPATYQAAAPPPGSSPDQFRAEFADGAVVEYDRGAHVLTATIPGDVVVAAEGDVEATAGGNIEATSGGEITATAAESIVLSATSITLTASAIRVNGPLTAGGANGEGYGVTIHGDVTQTGGDYTNPAGDVVASGKSLRSHIHTDSLGGSTSPPV